MQQLVLFSSRCREELPLTCEKKRGNTPGHMRSNGGGGGAVGIKTQNLGVVRRDYALQEGEGKTYKGKKNAQTTVERGAKGVGFACGMGQKKKKV